MATRWDPKKVGKDILKKGKEIVDRLKQEGRKILKRQHGDLKGQITIEGIFLAIIGFIILANMLPLLDSYINIAAASADPTTSMLLSWIKPVLVISFLSGIWSYSRVKVWGYR